MVRTCIIFEGSDEVIIGLKKDSKKIKRLWFDEGGRDIDEYNTYICDLTDGFSIGTKIYIRTADSLVEYNERIREDSDDG